MKNKLILLFLVVPMIALGHGNEDHSKETKSNNDDGWETITEKVSKEKLQLINELYLKTVKPVFKNKCLDCHGTGNPLPWYSIIPGPKQLIADDIKEAKKHMDMSNDFPFSGHGTPEDDLKALKKTIKDGSMPPLRYKILNWSSTLNDKEKKAINEWVDESLELINTKQEEKK